MNTNTVETMRLVFYYQTFQPNLDVGKACTHVHLAAIHFGFNADGSPYIHLNDQSPFSPDFDSVWAQMKALQARGVKIILMIGGAGGGYADLFGNIEDFYPLLLQCLETNPIDGVDLDIEEAVNLTDVVNLTCRLHSDCPDLLFTMAPLPNSLISDAPGLGGFSYRTLVNALAQQSITISYFNVQCYDSYTVDVYDSIVQNGYDPSTVVMGQLGAMSGTVPVAHALRAKYPTFGGVFTWEYYDTQPTPLQWATDMSRENM
jgi:hypothetical protein